VPHLYETGLPHLYKLRAVLMIISLHVGVYYCVFVHVQISVCALRSRLTGHARHMAPMKTFSLFTPSHHLTQTKHMNIGTLHNKISGRDICR